MLEPISAISALVGIPAAIIALGMSLVRLCDLVDDIKHEDPTLMLHSVKLKILKDEISFWGDTWGITTSTNARLLERYWGREADNVRTLLLTICTMYNDIIEELYRHYKRHFKWKTFSIDVKAIGRCHIENDINAKRDFEGMVSSFKGGIPTLKKIVRALRTTPQLGKHIKLIEECVKNLQEHSKNSFIRKHCCGDTTNWQDFIPPILLKETLLRIEKNFPVALPVMSDVIRDSDDPSLKIELQLDHGVAPTQRLEYLVAMADRNKIKFPLCFTYRNAKSQRPIGFSCKIAKGFSYHYLMQSLSEDLNRFLNDVVRATIRKPVGIIGEINHKTHTLKHEPRYEDLGDPRPVSKSLKMFLGQQLFLGQPRRLAEKIEVAYELVEWALLFFNTGWFSEICSCSISRAENNVGGLRYRARLCRIKHTYPLNDYPKGLTSATRSQRRENPPWCYEQAENQAATIRRIGFLLVEIFAGMPAYDISCGIHGIDFHPSLDPRGKRIASYDHSGVINMLSECVDEPILKAICFCTDMDMHAEQVSADTQTLQEQFFEMVVKPIFKIYYKFHIKEQVQNEDPVERQAALDSIIENY